MTAGAGTLVLGGRRVCPCEFRMRLVACLLEDDELDDLDQAVVLMGSKAGISSFLWFPRRFREKVTM